MKLFSTIRTKRNTAFFAMLVWLFVLASGIANACLLEVREDNGYVASARFSESADALPL
ncbi:MULTISPECIES: hypothetical protein [unclassified Variovorax]|uniref:hypothetical protein n=1 Tax=unclassified Variovorax TaxID=663243 RepID=UPI00076C376B|nr:MULTISPECIES: hypothetical protein [unclassified Variovorax]KWT91658.1 hypothetical protein APY03_3269 [Variovorax sp. WDL1]PNG49038.1 hypothetical protein CHC07_06680 [Variovorax sp. B4]PNG49684.1 hypothetical protein CHC06_05265 [Variovorax sp. B2]VTV18624.1 hypothetical protein WDL1P2_00301 [Variovorax sp. WDL1]